MTKMEMFVGPSGVELLQPKAVPSFGSFIPCTFFNTSQVALEVALLRKCESWVFFHNMGGFTFVPECRRVPTPRNRWALSLRRAITPYY